MKQLLALLGSMKTMAVLMMIFAVASGYATFIENDFGTLTAKSEIYNARWFEVLLAFLSLNLILNIIRFKMIQRQKALVLLFHVSFLVIVLGAAVTRYVGYEGTMHIREGETENRMVSMENYLSFNFDDNGKTSEYKKPVLFSRISDNSFAESIKVGDRWVDIKLLEVLPNASYQMIEDENGIPVANMMVTGSGEGKQIQLRLGEYFEGVDAVIDFGSGATFDKPVVSLFAKEGKLYMNHPMRLKFLKMDDQSSGELAQSEEEPMETRTLYIAGSTSFVVRSFYPKAVEKLVSVPAKPRMGKYPDALKIELRSEGHSATAVVFGAAGTVREAERVQLGDLSVELSYGARIMTLPFSLYLEDFELERYPGSMSPSSYASDVILIDKEAGVEKPFRIFMNHILEHKGYRFFQSSYDQDEAGTVLSVNYDPGTPVTYIGYLMLGLGMFGALFMRRGRFRQLMKIAEKASKQKEALTSMLIAMVLLYAPSLKAEEMNPVIKTITSFDKAHAERFGHLVIQDSSGRMKPLDTLSTEILNKINRSNSLLGMTPNQVVLGMMMKPDAWQEIKFIKTSDKKVNEVLGIDAKEKAAAFSHFFDDAKQVSGYRLESYVTEATRKAPAKRNKFDKAVLKVDERVNVAYMVFSGELLRIWPKIDDPGNKWHATIEALQTFPPEESEGIRELAVEYFSSIDSAAQSGDWSKADAALKKVAEYQRKAGAAVYVEEGRISAEIMYNHADIFERLWPLYFLVGFVLLILSFVKILRPKFKLDLFSKITLGLLILFFVVHTIGLGMRWYISGHAPWSDGYESMIYIAWATVLAGFIFSKNSPITMAATGILTGLILFVAHLNWMDPQVTNLVPVLQSYWLSIHVSMITASYGFLGLGALLGFITLMLFILKNEKNARHISLSITELNAINEMSLLIGLAMLTLGNFLGGVWANESWGRYWGWDPKETWALVTILVYAVVVHLRFIKALYSPFMFSVISLLSFSSVLMTYFGVNYYLAGLHSYAKGDPVPVPDFVPLTYTIIFIIIALAYRNRKLA